VFDRITKLPKRERRAAVMLLKTGDDSAYTDQDMSSEILIKKENELMSAGDPSVMQWLVASPVDDHILHCDEHKCALDRLRSMDAPKPNTPDFQSWQLAQQMLIKHINDHAIAWAKTNPVFAAVCSIPPPPMFNPAMGGFVPQVMGTPQSAPPADPGKGPGAGQMQAAPQVPPGPEETSEPPGPNGTGRPNGKDQGAKQPAASQPNGGPQ
jgi:hypothetical protein